MLIRGNEIRGNEIRGNEIIGRMPKERGYFWGSRKLYKRKIKTFKGAEFKMDKSILIFNEVTLW
ncbi:hypothetical protein [Desulfosarcina sp. BuS5]|uniref:hypothetical protein n=1 Tax=Desulfosarcina sp. BuS5 TaxID=933262 RepID=UPI00047FA4DE|nr:hypothetical protein [Desulfosarcina sp. BuS5]